MRIVRVKASIRSCTGMVWAIMDRSGTVLCYTLRRDVRLAAQLYIDLASADIMP